MLHMGKTGEYIARGKHYLNIHLILRNCQSALKATGKPRGTTLVNAEASFLLTPLYAP